MEPRKFRIAPTPSGFLHRGNATNFLLTACRAACAGAVLRLRIDDLDQERVRREYVEDIFESLCWLGIHWQEGPANVDDQEKSYSQRYRIPRYEALLQQLKESGKVFACNCSRTDLAVRGTMDYDGFCWQKGLSLEEPDVCWRIETPADATVVFYNQKREELTANVAEAIPYFIIRRRDGLPAYQLASLSDDLDYGITDIVRGKTCGAALLRSCISPSFWVAQPSMPCFSNTIRSYSVLRAKNYRNRQAQTRYMPRGNVEKHRRRKRIFEFAEDSAEWTTSKRCLPAYIYREYFFEPSPSSD